MRTVLPCNLELLKTDMELKLERRRGRGGYEGSKVEESNFVSNLVDFDLKNWELESIQTEKRPRAASRRDSVTSLYNLCIQSP